MVKNRKNMIPEPNIRRIIDAALDSWLDLSLGKKLRIGNMDSFGIVMGYQVFS
jgi:hypothetical protein